MSKAGAISDSTGEDGEIEEEGEVEGEGDKGKCTFLFCSSCALFCTFSCQFRCVAH